MKLFEARFVEIGDLNIEIQIIGELNGNNGISDFVRLIFNDPFKLYSSDGTGFKHLKNTYYCKLFSEKSINCYKEIFDKIFEFKKCFKRRSKTEELLPDIDYEAKEFFLFISNLAAFLGNPPSGEPLWKLDTTRKPKHKKLEEYDCGNINDFYQN
jgi:hypothetical protein